MDERTTLNNYCYDRNTDTERKEKVQKALASYPFQRSPWDFFDKWLKCNTNALFCNSFSQEKSLGILEIPRLTLAEDMDSN